MNQPTPARFEYVGYGELLRTFGHVGLVSFGGPAGQIALMHRVIVDDKGWLEEKRFLHALNFCMLLPGPEAMQLATYCGWLLRGVPGGLLAGSLFVLPGFIVMLVLSALYVTFGDVPLVAGLLFGLKAAVLAIVLQALLRVSARALKGGAAIAMAVAAFAALAVLKLPFPLVIAAAALTGLLFPGAFGQGDAGKIEDRPGGRPWRHLAGVAAGTIAFWMGPVALLIAALGPGHVYSKIALFFSKTAVVTFGGAYAVLSYVGQQAVETYRWLTPEEMLTGLGLAETTPGPLILVLVFTGFAGAFRDAGGLDPLLSGMVGAMITLWVTFIPCFIWIFAGAPYVETLRGNRKPASAFAAITAAVVGVIANLSLWFALHVLFAEVGVARIGPLQIWQPEMTGFDWVAGAIAFAAGILLWRGAGLFTVLGLAVVAGVLARLSGL